MNIPVRLSDHEVAAICEAFRTHFLSGDPPLAFWL